MSRKQNNQNSEIVHTIARINNREFLLVDKVIGLFFNLLHLIFPKYSAEVYAAVIMTNHIHLLHHIPSKNPQTKYGKRSEKKGVLVKLGDLKRHFLSQFARQANSLLQVNDKGKVVLNFQEFTGKLRQRFGCLIENRSKSIPVINDNHGLANLIYIFLNPVRAGIVKHPKDYKYSNYNMYSSGILQDGYKFHPDYLALGSTLEICARVFTEMVEEQLMEILISFSKNIKNTWDKRDAFKTNIFEAIAFVTKFFKKRL